MDLSKKLERKVKSLWRLAKRIVKWSGYNHKFILSEERDRCPTRIEIQKCISTSYQRRSRTLTDDINFYLNPN